MIRLPFICLIVLLVVVIIIVVVLVVWSKSKRKEGFFDGAAGATVRDKAIYGPMLLTNQMVEGDSSALIDEVANDRNYARPGTLGATKSNSLDKLLANQIEIQSINDRNNGKLMSEADQRKISDKIQSSAALNVFNMYNRAGDKNVRFSVEPAGTRAVIDEAALGFRDRNEDITSVRRVIPVKMYNMDMTRIPIEMMQQKRMLGKNSDNKHKGIAREAVFRNIDEEDTIDPNASLEKVEEGFERFRGSNGVMVVGNSLK